MSDDYGFSGSRKTKNDKKAKARFNRYKKGGHFRGQNVKMSSGTDNN